MTSLGMVAHESGEAIARARASLVSAVRAAAASGMSQREIAKEIGRSQPEVSRLLRFHGTSPLGRRLRSARSEVLRIVGEAGGSNVRVFGSLATGRDTPDSDVDLLFRTDEPMGLMGLSRLEQEISEAIGASVDLVPDSNLRPFLRDRVLAEAVQL
ncbi:MAG: nucleotidyltransferase domain-containing protein [Ornithinimicrobium sp.]